MKTWKPVMICVLAACAALTAVTVHRASRRPSPSPRRPALRLREASRSSYGARRMKRTRTVLARFAPAPALPALHETPHGTGALAVKKSAGSPAQRKNAGAGSGASPAPGKENTSAAAAQETASPSAPAITTAALPPAVAGASYYTPLFAEGGTLPYAWRVAGGSLPSGLSLDGAHGFISGTAAIECSQYVAIAVSDAVGRGASREYLLTVNKESGMFIPKPSGAPAGAGTDAGPSPPEPLYIVTGSLPDASVSRAYTARLEGRGGTLPYAWSVLDGALPDGIELRASDGALFGVPESAQRAVFRIRLADSESRADVAELRLNVMNPALAIATTNLSPAVVGLEYLNMISATGGTPPYLWSAENLPEGFTMDPRIGQISGTALAAGESIILVEVFDSNDASASASFDFIINEAPLGIVTPSLPAGELDSAYQALLEAEGGAPPYAWSLSSGELPRGLSLSPATGLLSGTPSGEAGEYALQFTATDTEGGKASREYALSIAEPPSFSVTSLAAAPSDGKAGITWVNPSHKDYSHTALVRSTSGYPKTAGDGAVIFTGAGTSFLDRGLVNGTVYYYAGIPYKRTGSAGAVTEGSRASVIPEAVTLSGPGDPYADEVVSFQPLSSAAFGSPALARGAPMGGGTAWGSTHVVSLGARANDDGGASKPYGGSITLRFTDNIVTNGPGPDFTVYENVFYVGGDPERRWMEPGVVSVSRDGVRWHTFPFDFVPHYTQAGEINCYNPYCYRKGFAGVAPVYSFGGSPDPRNHVSSGGDAFDLDEITRERLDWIRYVRITATGDNWFMDMNGDMVRHQRDMGACSGSGSSGFDLDAVCAIHY